MALLARTTPLEEVEKPSHGLSLFFIDFDKTKPGLDLRKIKKMGGRAVELAAAVNTTASDQLTPGPQC